MGWADHNFHFKKNFSQSFFSIDFDLNKVCIFS